VTCRQEFADGELADEPGPARHEDLHRPSLD
jgi:hypothetical protein